MADHIDTDVEVDVRGGFHAWLSDGGEFQADSIRGFLTPESDGDDQSPPKLVPDRFQISGNVRLDTTAIAAETDLLSLFFVAEDDPQANGTRGAGSGPESTLRQYEATTVSQSAELFR